MGQNYSISINISLIIRWAISKPKQMRGKQGEHRRTVFWRRPMATLVSFHPQSDDDCMECARLFILLLFESKKSFFFIASPPFFPSLETKTGTSWLLWKVSLLWHCTHIKGWKQEKRQIIIRMEGGRKTVKGAVTSTVSFSFRNSSHSHRTERMTEWSRPRVALTIKITLLTVAWIKVVSFCRLSAGSRDRSSKARQKKKLMQITTNWIIFQVLFHFSVLLFFHPLSHIQISCSRSMTLVINCIFGFRAKLVCLGKSSSLFFVCLFLSLVSSARF